MLIKKGGLSWLEKTIGYNFVRKELLEQALTHRSYAVEQIPRICDNERLEFLGDAVLDLVISHLLFSKYANDYGEGDLTRMRAFLVNEAQLARQSRRLGMAGHLLLGKGEARGGGHDKPSILADAFEALVGAIYMDGGMGPAFSFVQRSFGGLLDDALSLGLGQDYKTNLQEAAQRSCHDMPVYAVECISGPDHERVFTVALSLQGKMLARATGRSKKEAEQKAARIALEMIGSKEETRDAAS
ncbi:MAG: ribonuclease III [Desulfobacteraceae bacterium]|nr:ribonuclease III [Desulfobacteraceae bacterium]